MSSLPHPDLENLKDGTTGPLAIVVSQCVEGSSLVEAHSHGRGQLLGVWRGLLTLGTEFGKWLVPNVHAVWIPPGQLHWASVHGQVDAWSVYVQSGACEGLPDQPATLRISALLREAVRRLERPDDETGGPMRDLLERVVVNEIQALPVEELSLPMPTSPSLVKIAQGLLAEPAEERSLDDWAALANVSPRTLNRRFPMETGYSLGAWRQRARLLRGLELLAEGRSVTTVALELGYCNISAFIALFKRTFGVTPTQYMRQA
ncbi:helix-turn-helix transcriptional regulator [Variovorax sp. ZS18.2.2]|uniref:helix-turn-helix domain-containing protein n=1 Tax=Variovorax sp. ZS18.2.2 TaxID=2971255 RepID=UPI0021510835|nr:helix-turn-helix transcriptional regulator [Variovorax sp. ZS18.2.2]MCR6475971.1 helix-turn-helix transcriptional regulator [Variovorax sp. ZS18.2.2]